MDGKAVGLKSEYGQGLITRRNMSRLWGRQCSMQSIGVGYGIRRDGVKKMGWQICGGGCVLGDQTVNSVLWEFTLTSSLYIKRYNDSIARAQLSIPTITDNDNQ
jgi:hypothetical protein